MNSNFCKIVFLIAISFCLVFVSPANANGYREKDKPVKVAKSDLIITPPRDWNRLRGRIGKNAETWTLDGELLNEVTFFGDIEPGKPLVKERSKKHDPLPKVDKNMLLIDIPELLERTYRSYKKIGIFELTMSEPSVFLDQNGIKFTYKFVDKDELPRLGEGVAALINGNLYMITFDAPRLYYFERTVEDYRALVSSAQLKKK